MKKFYQMMVKWHARRGVPATIEQVAAKERRRFERLRPGLVKAGWPVPVTEEGKSVCMDLLLCPCRTL